MPPTPRRRKSHRIIRNTECRVETSRHFEKNILSGRGIILIYMCIICQVNPSSGIEVTLRKDVLWQNDGILRQKWPPFWNRRPFWKNIFEQTRYFPNLYVLQIPNKSIQGYLSNTPDRHIWFSIFSWKSFLVIRSKFWIFFLFIFV